MQHFAKLKISSFPKMFPLLTQITVLEVLEVVVQCSELTSQHQAEKTPVDQVR